MLRTSALSSRENNMMDGGKQTSTAVGRKGLLDISNKIGGGSTTTTTGTAAGVGGKKSTTTIVPLAKQRSTTISPPFSLDEVDSGDVKDVRMVADYAWVIYDNLLKMESKHLPSPTYMTIQTDVTARMRCILIDWLVEVHLKFKLFPQTLYIAVNILDRYLEKKIVSRDELQLIGCTALWAASKIEEIYSPEVEDFVLVSDRAFKRDDLLAMEGKMLNALEFKLTFPTHYVFLTRWCKVANADKRQKLLALYCVERTLQEYSFLRFKPSTIAAAGLLVALEATTNSNASQWTPLLEKHTGLTEESLKQCSEEIRTLIKDAETRSLLAVRKKYLTEDNGFVAKIPVVKTDRANVV